MLEWINSNGIEVILAYLAFAAIVGSMPPLPDNSSYWARWAYAALHGLAMNFRSALELLKLPVPTDKPNDPTKKE